MRQKVIDGVAENLKTFYVYPDIAQKMVDDLRARQKRGEFDAITDGDEFAARLTRDLQASSHDKHLNVDFSPYKLAASHQGPTSDDETQFRKMLEQTNCGFEKIEILPRDIGDLKFNMFADPAICGPTRDCGDEFSCAYQGNHIRPAGERRWRSQDDCADLDVPV